MGKRILTLVGIVTAATMSASIISSYLIMKETDELIRASKQERQNYAREYERIQEEQYEKTAEMAVDSVFDPLYERIKELDKSKRQDSN